MISEETKRVIGLDNGELDKWRSGGRSQKARTFLLVAGVSIVILFAFKMLSAAPLPQDAGQRMHRQWGPEQRLDRLSQKLNLTDDQKAQIKPLLEDQHRQMMALREDTSLSREQKRAKFQEIRKQTFEKMNPILSPEQQKQFQQMQQMRHERRGHRGWNQAPGAN